ncbi:hypothetical protein [Tepidibacter hydrothermalis]|uniref:4Fe-4S ferredoxin-type domain-containing protein n=1 Tax=Tepidibacter hydrothermalis TaxID=3036126 RepID=A0ABY8EL25_9FIRM|nr:hypothetical protein [Tepidibacter hydrothermalis]WFD12045.1 hypothetical protein P4S50_08190 [Tepidibacter hydrothermalis]
MREECKKCGLCKNVTIEPLEGEYIELKDDNIVLKENKNSLNKIKYTQQPKPLPKEYIELIDDFECK